MNTVIPYFITNSKKFYIDVNGYWTTNRNEAQHHWENQIKYIRQVNPLSHLHRMQYEIV